MKAPIISLLAGLALGSLVAPALSLGDAPAPSGDALKIEVHKHACVDATVAKLSEAVDDYDRYACNPNAKFKLNGELLQAAGISLPSFTPGIDTQIAALTYSTSWNAPPVASTPSLQAKWVWLQFQPLNLSCTGDSPECRQIALHYPRFLLYCLPSQSADGAVYTDHCKLVADRRAKGVAPPPLLDNFSIDAYDGKVVMTQNADGCTPGQTGVSIDIQALMKGKDLDSAIDLASIPSLLKDLMKSRTLQTLVYNGYFESFYSGFVSEVLRPTVCTVTPPPTVENPVHP